MTMAEPVVLAEDAPPILVVSLTELGNRSGTLAHLAATGYYLRVDNLSTGITVCWIVPPDRAPEDIRPWLHLLPAPGEAADRIPAGVSAGQEPGPAEP